MTVEIIPDKREFEQLAPHETERKFIPIFSDQLSEFRDIATPIEQYYLSHPDEPFSLRFRSKVNESDQLEYSATLKDIGTIDANGITRIEVEVPITVETYEAYKSTEAPVIRKLRAEPLPGITIDFYDDGSVLIESENPDSWSRFKATQGDGFMEVTGDKSADNEWRAHLNFRRANGGRETLKPQAELSAIDIVNDILAAGLEKPRAIHIGGRSGSGKSTIVRAVQARLDEYSITSSVLSTDDYHRGVSWLVDYNGGNPWTAWDEAIVYDTVTMRQDIAKLKAGELVPRREIDWQIIEPTVNGQVIPAQVIIIEGIYARCPEITDPDDLSYEMTTSIATCIGRRLLRDMRERPEFADPIKSLRYMLEQAEPAYLLQNTVTTNCTASQL